MESIVVHTTCKKPDVFLVLGVIGALVLHCHLILLLLKVRVACLYFSTPFVPAAVTSGYMCWWEGLQWIGYPIAQMSRFLRVYGHLNDTRGDRGWPC